MIIAHTILNNPNWLSLWVGPVIIASIVTIIGQIIIHNLTNKSSKLQEEEKAMTDSAAPAVAAADDVISRFFETIIRKGKFEVIHFEEKCPSTFSIVENPPRDITTVFRVIKLLACSIYLARQKPKYSNVKQVQRSIFFTSNKIRMSLKGNVTASKIQISTETQQYIGSHFLDITKNKSPHELDFYSFIKTCQNSEDSWKLAKLLSKLLAIDNDFTSMSNEKAALSVFLIYMIDFYQEMEKSGKWEEFRLFLCTYLRKYNLGQTKRPIYLYTAGDLTGDNYWATFPNLDSNKQNESLFRRKCRIKKRQRPGREISNAGLTKTSSDNQRFFAKFASSPEEVLTMLRANL